METGEDRSSCGCNEIFCCIFSSSHKDRHSHQKQDCLPAYSASTTELKPTRLLEQEKLEKNAVYGAPNVGQHVHQQGSSRLGSDVNETFSDYISRTKIKIRAMSNIGSDGGEIVYPKEADAVYDYYDAEKKADANDMFSDYINRAKLKIRRTSSLGSKKAISFRKRE
ncbi:hypothetical protein TIFTF001_000998 [Ficus carica]|uniref:Uncharacterized protein n=1 Tax=Ficus carica TaxID=3494 RepID=A0AA87ZG02_FICCA|nr:hypothetical protein TIFTF001_000998 [Ficus carica]